MQTFRHCLCSHQQLSDLLYICIATHLLIVGANTNNGDAAHVRVALRQAQGDTM